MSPRYISRYYLRLILCYRRGPRSFEDLKTGDGVVMEAYKAPAYHLEYDEESHRCLLETSAFLMPRQLKYIFAVLLVYSKPASSSELWEAHMQALCKDFQRDELNSIRYEVSNDQQSTDNTGEQPVHRRAIYVTLRDIHEHLLTNGQNLEIYGSRIPHRGQQITDTLQWEMIFLDPPWNRKIVFIGKILAYVRKKKVFR
ncbi:Helitron helicase [Phytophthora megakarya]|uniref:Helitron helicase n=1 Tax=Phytophthora megakarya TaxID=4795 RepID=A0A225WZY6_9STRA|nr:Helitron helicase [Phytophthora megakarya]